MSKFDPYDHLKLSLNSDGSVTRYLHVPITPATGEIKDSSSSCHSVLSKDFVLNKQKKTWVRVFLPSKSLSNDSSHAKLPILIYLHAGGFVNFSIATTMMHENCNRFSSELPAIVVGIDYRLAPENRLPAAYEDATDTIVWIKSQFLNENGEKWLKRYGDSSRCYIYGVSNGGNIALHAALRALDMELAPIKINGLIMNQPLFGGKQRTKSELKYATDPYFPLPAIDLVWELALPPGADRDHRYCNPLIDENIREKMKCLGRCLVIGFGGDATLDKQQDLVQWLVLQGVLVEARFDNVGFHLIDTIDQRRAAAIVTFVKDFV